GPAAVELRRLGPPGLEPHPGTRGVVLFALQDDVVGNGDAEACGVGLQVRDERLVLDVVGDVGADVRPAVLVAEERLVVGHQGGEDGGVLAAVVAVVTVRPGQALPARPDLGAGGGIEAAAPAPGEETGAALPSRPGQAPAAA